MSAPHRRRTDHPEVSAPVTPSRDDPDGGEGVGRDALNGDAAGDGRDTPAGDAMGDDRDTRDGDASGDDADLASVVAADDEDEATRTMARQGSVTFAGDVVKKLFGFVIIAVITRLVSPGVYGLFVIASSLVLFVQTLAGLGLSRAVDYYVPQYLSAGDEESARGVVRTATGIALVSSTIVAGVLITVRHTVAGLFDEPALGIALLMLAVTFPMLAIYKILLASFNAIKRLKYRVYMRDFVRTSVRLLVTAVLLILGYGLIGIVAGYIVGLFVAMCVGIALLVRHAPGLVRGPGRPADPRPLLSYATPLAIAGLIYVILGQIDYFVIGVFGTSEGVGIYRVGYMLASNLLIVFTAVSPVFKPLIAEVRLDDAAVQRHYRTATRWVAGLTLPLAITVTLGASAYLSLIFTDQYVAGTIAVAILSFGYYVNVVCGGPDGALLQGLGYSRLVFLNTSLLLVTNLVGSLLLVPRLGITGAAIGTASALTISGLAAITEVYVVRDIHPFTRDLGKVFVAGVPAGIAGAIVLVVAPDIVVAVFLPLVVFGTYAAGLVFTSAFTQDDVSFASELSPRAGEVVASFL